MNDKDGRAAKPNTEESDDAKAASVFEIVISDIMKQKGHGTSRLDAAKCLYDRQCETFGRLFADTKNPVWISRFLVVAHHTAIRISESCPEARGQMFVGPLPEWCMKYLLESAFKIDGLAHCVFRSEADAADAIARLPSALGFVRKGWNGFDEFSREYIPRLAADTADVERMKYGLTATKTIDRFIEHARITDERYARRLHNRLRQTRRVKAPPNVDPG